MREIHFIELSTTRNSCDAEEDGPGSLVGKETLDAAALSVTRDEEEELERMFEQVRVSNAIAAKNNDERLPKIMLSPREETVTRSLRDKGPYTYDVRKNVWFLDPFTHSVFSHNLPLSPFDPLWT